MNVFSVINMKGGIAKTTTTQQIGIGLARTGMKVLLVDADPQGNLTSLMLPEIDFDGIDFSDLNFEPDPADHKNTLVDMLMKTAAPEECIYKTAYENLDIIPTSLDLSTTIYDLQSNAANGMPQLRLKHQLKSLDYDVILIDNSPSLNMMTVNSIYAANKIIIPTSMSKNSLKGMWLTLKQCKRMIEELDVDVPYQFMVLGTMKNRNKDDCLTAEKLKDFLGDMFFSTVIRYQAAPIRKAENGSRALIDDNKSSVAQDYRDFLSELMERM